MREKLLHLFLLMSIFIQLPGVIAAHNTIRGKLRGRTSTNVELVLRLAAGQETRKEKEQLFLVMTPALLNAHG